MSKCPVCKTEHTTTESVCASCGFNQLNREFINQEELIRWMEETVYPCQAVYKKMSSMLDSLSSNGVAKNATSGRRSVAAISNADYEDSRIAVKFKGINRTSNLFYGDGFEFKFIVQNKTNYEMRVKATEVTVNGFVVSNDELINSEAAANKKTIDSIYLFDGKMNTVDVFGVDDIEQFEFKIQYEIEAINYTFESEPISVVPFEA